VKIDIEVIEALGVPTETIVAALKAQRAVDEQALAVRGQKNAARQKRWRRFCAIAASMNSNRAPRGPRNRKRPSAECEVLVSAFAAWPATLRRPAPPATLAQPPTLN
jgi:hypothetical protein